MKHFQIAAITGTIKVGPLPIDNVLHWMYVMKEKQWRLGKWAATKSRIKP